MTHLLLHGNCYAQIHRTNGGRAIGLYPLAPNRVRVEREDSGEIVYQYTPTAGEKQFKSSEQVTLSSWNVLHIPALGFDGLIGYSPIAMARNAIGVAIATEEFGAKFFEQGARPSGILSHPGIIKDFDKLREEWQKIYGGSSNTGKVAILEEGMKYESIAIPPNDAQFLDTRKFQINEIARIFRIPPHMLAELERATFSNITHQSLEFVMYTLNPWLSRWEQCMNKALFLQSERGKFFVKFNVDGLLRGDIKTRYDAYAVGRQQGWLSTNDIRRLEDLNLIPEEDGGDLYLINGAMTKLADAGLFANKKSVNINTTDKTNNSLL